MTSPASQPLLHQLCFAAEPPAVVLVAAHPDDEVIGAGAQLSRWARQAQLIHLTDGSPPDLHDAQAAGLDDRPGYARARWAELQAAMSLAGITREQLHPFGFADQEASLHLARAARLLARSFEQLQAALVVTHPYEGGHPDHDATAFAVHAACALLSRHQRPAPVVLEMTSYFNSAGIMRTGEFLPCAGPPPTTLPLDSTQRRNKRDLLACYTTQQKVLQYFPIGHERFRVAPRYDFTKPPHPGKLYYELFDWGMSGERWRQLATSAIQALGLRPFLDLEARDPANEPFPPGALTQNQTWSSGPASS